MRPRRIEYPGAIYHVMQRGNNKEIIFRCDNDKRFFIAQLANTKKMFGFELYAYVLLDNHYHLLLKAGETPLQKIMQRQNSLYSRFYNRSHDRSGHLFGLRYRAYIIHDERYLLAVLSYIHLNPVNAGIADCLSGYEWSSDYYYRHNKSGLVDIDFILNSISSNRRKAVNEYLHILKDETAENYNTLEAIIIEENQIEVNRSQLLEQILVDSFPDPEVRKLIKTGSRKRDLKPSKKHFVKEALNQGFKIKEIAEFFNVSIKAVHKMVKDENPTL